MYKRCYISRMKTHNRQPRTLGTALRHLLEMLDGDVESAYRDAKLPIYRPRYTPLMRVLATGGSVAICDLASRAGISHSAASQTVARMKADGLVTQATGADGRERVVALSRRGKAMLPRLKARWEATNAAAEELDAELSVRLTECIEEAIAALEARPFKERIAASEARLKRKEGE
jgi:DNA-binding MarR family transcriptional regulator